MKVIGIIGRKNSGKTHLVVRLIGEFGRRGLSVSTIKHTHHHDVALDAPGKDSSRHREAGAREVIVASDGGWFLVHAGEFDRPSPLPMLLERLAPCDLVLVEGYKNFAAHPRIEVYRSSTDPAAPPLAADDPTIFALACPAAAAPSHWPVTAARLELDDQAAIADFILAQ